ncbi:uncharacterized protein [Lolium perenne]|uniref:uncharacterized protein n=1 Tax=Lolium perenne TaxID=4522 RepID=UPI0021F52813|nr:uncharacterized protein LOC127315870 [Lolium perenne]
MDKSWMEASRSSDEYAAGVSLFLKFAIRNEVQDRKILCPCKNCGNRFWYDVDIVNDHLVCTGFMPGYKTWLFHGEPAVNNDPDTHSSSPEDSSNARDEIDQLLLDGFDMYNRSSLHSEKEEGSEDDSEDEDVETYKRLVNDGGQLLYPGCKKFSKLQFLVRLLNIKNVRGMTNAAFEDMLTLFREAIPEGHSLPKKFHEAKQYIRGVGLAYDTYDVCFNDCIIFRGIHANANVCPVCKTSRWKTERSVVGGKRISRVARKVIRHFPLKKRVRRLFISNKTAALMSWHNDGRTKDEVMRHPADSPAWKNFDSRYRSFSKEPRNIRFGLATDGFNPFRNMNLSYSIWPIILIPYNFPPWICMKETNFILSVIVPGRRSPGKDIDVYLQLVIDELQELWHHGVLVHDAHFGKKFRVYAALLWTISDWLGRGILSGESIVVCSHCLLGTCSRRLKHGHKACFLGHRRFLSRDHAFRRDEESFDGTTDFRDPPVQPTGEEISAMTMDIQTAYGKLQKQKRSVRKKRKRGEGDEDLENKEEVHTVESTFKKRSIFFQLEYWKFLLVRHNLDSMHIEKNVFDNIVNTLLDVDKRSKDNANARMDMKRMKIREHLHIDETQEKPDLPDAVYYMESSKKKMFCGLVKNVRFPDNHASSMYNKVRLEENKFVGLKTHDCHILFEEILPLAVMKTLPKEVALPLVKLAKCFKVITSKIVSNKEIAIVEDQLPEILCQLEKIFPPTFFDIMEHLVIHLPAEVRLAGPVQFRNMWSTEMFIGNMKNWVHNRSHPEGSIAESYLFDECLTFCSRYVDDCNTKFNRAPRHDDNLTSSANKNCSKYLTIFGRPLSACSISELDYLSWTQAQKYVLFNYEHISSYTEKHMKSLAAGKKRKCKRQIEVEHHRTFHTWFIDHVQSLLLKGTKLPEDIVLLANKPYMMVKKYNSYSINCRGSFYNIKVSDLGPHSVQQISLFVALCECYLGCPPYFPLWEYTPPGEVCIPQFSPEPSVPRRLNVRSLPREQEEVVKEMRQAIQALKDSGLTAVNIAGRRSLTTFPPLPGRSLRK